MRHLPPILLCPDLQLTPIIFPIFMSGTVVWFLAGFISSLCFAPITIPRSKVQNINNTLINFIFHSLKHYARWIQRKELAIWIFIICSQHEHICIKISLKKTQDVNISVQIFILNISSLRICIQIFLRILTMAFAEFSRSKRNAISKNDHPYYVNKHHKIVQNYFKEILTLICI